MLTFRRLFLAGGALLCAAVLAHCDSNTASNTDGGAADSGTSSDLLAAAPVLTMVSPSSAVNTGGTLVTLTGSNFQPGATVTFAGVAATNVTVVSSTQITCTVPAKAATCGAVPVQVSNPDGKMAARTDAFYLSSPTLSFAAVSSLPMAMNPRQVIAADLNNDAKLDLISANSGSANVTVRLGNGDGTFGAVGTVVIGTGTSPYAVAAADVNGDGKLDLVTANNNSNNIAVRIGNGDGTFTTPTMALFSVGAGPYDLAIGDLNGDGKRDVVVVNNGSNNVSSLLGNGDGTFQAQMTTTLNGTQPTAILLADFNNDQKLDFGTAEVNGNSVTVRLGNGSGGFGLGANVMGVNGPMDLVAADFNADSKLDLAIANSTTGTVRLSLGNGDGTFLNAATPAVSTGASNRSIAVGDFNADGKPDLAVTNVAANNVSILLSNGDATFAAQQTFPLGTTPSHVTVADLNKDGLPDLVATDQGAGAVVVRLNQCQ